MNKKYILLLERWGAVFTALTNTQAGELIKAIYEFDSSGKEPKIEDKLVSFTFKTNILPTMQEVKESYQKKCEANKANGSKGGRPKKK